MAWTRRDILYGGLASIVTLGSVAGVTRALLPAPFDAYRDIDFDLFPEMPVQEKLSQPRSVARDGFTFELFATFSVSAVILSRRRYRWDDMSFAPVDLALGWGPMSNPSVVSRVSVGQSGRFYRWRFPGDAGLHPDVVSVHSANMHLVPADDVVRSTMLDTQERSFVRVDGFLCDVYATNGARWRSSRTRTDTGGGACEIVWTTAVQKANVPLGV